MVYPVYTLSGGKVEPGADILTLTLKAGGEIPAIIVGEEGRGRSRGVIPVANPPRVPCPERGKTLWTRRDECSRCGVHLAPSKDPVIKLHPDDGVVLGRLMAAEIGQTRTGNPKFLAREKADTDEAYIGVFRTPIGYRGSNSHRGDYLGWECPCGATGMDPTVPDECPSCGRGGSFWIKMKFLPFPGQILARGVIAQGDAGRMGSGEQIVALIPKGAVVRTGYTGRLYGGPPSHYYKWDGEKVLSATWQERAVSEIF